VGSIPIMSPLIKAYSYLTDAPALPAGIDVMREDSGALSMMNHIGGPTRVSCWGSRSMKEKRLFFPGETSRANSKPPTLLRHSASSGRSLGWGRGVQAI